MNSNDVKNEVTDKYSLRGRVFNRIREDILSGKYKENDELKEMTIGEELGVSRTPVREAFRQLELEGLIQIIPNKGAYVTGITKKDVKDIYMIRSLLEGLCAAWATDNISEELMEELEENVYLADFHVNKGHFDQVAQLDNRFHEILYIASGSKQLEHRLRDFHQYVARIRKRTLATKERSIASNNEHRMIMEAMKEKDAKKAQELANMHMINAYENMIKSIGNTCSILCRAEINNWQGRKSVSLIISDIHDDDYNIDNILRCVYNSDYITGRGFVIDRKMLVIMYKLILQYGEGFKFNDLFRIRENMRQRGVPCTWYEIRSGLDIFTELGLVTRKDKQTFSVAKNSEKVDLTESLLYKMVQVEV